MSELSDNLRKSTEAMATGCSAHPELWNTHANDCLAAANEIERLQTALKNARDILGYSASIYIAGCSEDVEYNKRRSEIIAEIVATTGLTE